MRIIRATRRRARALAALLLLGVACKNFESYAPHLVTLGGTVLQVVALNYVGVKYQPAVSLLMNSLTPTAAAMTATWAQEYRRQKDLAALEQIEQEIRAEQAALERARAEAAQAAAAVGVIAKSAPAADARPLAVDVALLRVRGDTPPVPLRDGETLHDGRDGAAPAEGLRVLVRPEREAYVYVVAFDAVGRVQPLYPSVFEAPAAPVPAGTPLLLPSALDAYGLDEYRGVQHVVVYASEAPNSSLEVQLARFARDPMPAPEADEVYVVSEPTAIEAGPGATVSPRGLTNVRPVARVDLEGTEGSLAIDAERAVAEPGESVVVTRWFEHK
jgi:hypothetical protein